LLSFLRKGNALITHYFPSLNPKELSEKEWWAKKTEAEYLLDLHNEGIAKMLAKIVGVNNG